MINPTSVGWGAGLGAGSERKSADLSASRRLLRRLTEIVGAPISAQHRLDRIVSVIAADIVAEVCSLYVLRSGDLLELFATEGLAPTAVHQTRLRVGEGLVGHIAAQGQLINTADAQHHPSFAYRPETGEERFQSFLGVPILYAGQVTGVLTVQNTAQRTYQEDEVEALEIIATLLSEMLAGGTLLDKSRYADLSGLSAPRRLEGRRLVEGVTIGHAVFHQPPPVVTQLVADNPDFELVRLEQAIDDLKSSVDRLVAAMDVPDGEHSEVLEAYRMFAHDRGWYRRIREAIETGLTAEAAVKRVQEQTRLRLERTQDSYLRERLLDLDDLAYRLLGHLTGRPLRHDPSTLPSDAIIIARALSPADLLEYDRYKLRGVVLEEGSQTAHVTIIARAMEMPMLGRVERATTLVNEGDVIGLDGDNGQLFLRPNSDVIRAFSRSVASRQTRRERYRALKDLPSVSRDGITINLNINAAFLADLPALEETGAAGIGLYRTELGFMARGRFPRIDEQTALYKQILDGAGDRRVVFRTLDVGSDKTLPYWQFPEEENPAMGWRAMRLALDRPAVLRGQLRALLYAAGGRDLAVMFPMITEVAELEQARRLLTMEEDRLRKQRVALPKSLQVGAMLEVPALLWQLDALLDRVDFLSVGSNDLLQFLFASDRSNPNLHGRYDALSPAVLSLMRMLVQRCREKGVRLSVCGEIAARPLDAMALIGTGLRDLSMSATQLGQVRAMVRSVEIGELSRFMDRLYELPDHSARASLLAYARDHDIDLGDRDDAG
ncbi:MAG: phosphoenolpyruvate--protein phosphotransferase [Geminicoccaceae bacterium]